MNTFAVERDELMLFAEINKGSFFSLFTFYLKGNTVFLVTAHVEYGKESTLTEVSDGV